jgi:hypothetical protein
MDRFALVGRPARCREGLSRMIDAGMTHPVLGLGVASGGDSTAAVRDVAEQLVGHFL